MDIVVAGFGRMGRHHNRIAGELGHNVVAVIDPVAKTDDVPLHRGWADVPEADLAIIATPSALHESAALAAFEHGMHALIEKPLAPTPAACQRIQAAAEAAGVIGAVGHVERFNSAFMAYNPADVVHVVAQRWSPRPARITDVGVTMDIGIHDLDLCRTLIGDATVVARHTERRNADVDTAMQATMAGEGRTATVDASWHSPTQRRLLQVMEADRLVAIDLLNQTIDVGNGPAAIAEPEGETALHRQLVDIARAVATSAPPKVDLSAGRAAVELAHAAIS